MITNTTTTTTTSCLNDNKELERADGGCDDISDDPFVLLSVSIQHENAKV
jgi:hypothetical protein